MHCAKTRKIAVYFPMESLGFSGELWFNPSGLSMALRSTKPLTQVSTRGISWGVEAVGAWGWQPSKLHMQIIYKFCDPQIPRALRDCLDLDRDRWLVIILVPENRTKNVIKYIWKQGVEENTWSKEGDGNSWCRNCVMRSFVPCTPQECCSEQIKED